MLLSFRLFRPRAISPVWFAIACFTTAVIGIIGLKSRLPRLIWAISNIVSSARAGETGTLLQLLWLAGVILLALGASLWLSRHSHTRQLWLWWGGLATFIAFLPNAPYVLTDIIHLLRGTSAGIIKIWVIAFIFIPIHAAVILVGFEAYVVSLLNVGFYLKQKGLAAFTLPMELCLHGLSALGIYLGRFIRLNSWDMLVDPTSVIVNTLNTLTSRRPLAVICFSFILLTILYWMMKQVTLGLRLRAHYARRGIDPLD